MRHYSSLDIFNISAFSPISTEQFLRHYSPTPLGGLNILLCLFFVSLFISLFDAHREGVGGIKVYPPSEIFAKLVNKNAIKTPKRYTLPPKFSQPLYTLPSTKGPKPYGPSPWIFKPCASMISLFISL